MGMSIDDLKKECKYCYREIDASGLEGFRCTNKTVIKTTGSSWCYHKNANEPCSKCDHCKPKEEIKMTIEESLEWLISRKEHYEMDDDCQELAQSLGCAIDTMNKYQKIEQILSDWINDDSVGMSDYWMGRIKEVVEDGKTD